MSRLYFRENVLEMNTAIGLLSTMYFQWICSSVKSEWNPRVILPRKSVHHHHIYLCFVWMWTSRLYFRENLFPQWTQLYGFSQVCISNVSVHQLNLSETQGLYFRENLSIITSTYVLSECERQGCISEKICSHNEHSYTVSLQYVFENAGQKQLRICILFHKADNHVVPCILPPLRLQQR